MSAVPTSSPRPLTDAEARALKAGAVRVDRPDGRVPGLYLSVLPSGLKQWTLRYRHAGKQRRLVLGEFGDAPKLSLSKAREAAEKKRPQIREGADPVAERAAAKAPRADTVAALAADYLDEHARKVKKDGGAEDERVLERDVLPHWRDRSVREITRRDVKELLKPIAKRAPIMANRTLEIVRKMLNYAVAEEWIDANPAARMPKPGGPERKRERVLSDDEIRRLWALLERFPATHEKRAPGRPQAKTDANGDPFCPLSPALATVQKIRLLTAQRGGEVIQMRWSDVMIDPPLPGQPRRGWWTIPAEHAKNGRAHRVPLAADAVAVLDSQQPDADKRTGHVFTGRGDAIPIDRVKKAGAACARALGTDIRSHDLRRTAATRMAAAGIPSAHISHVLNHTPAGAAATRIYNLHDYDAEKRTALETWARELRRILAESPKTGAAVVPLTRRAVTPRTR